MVDTVFGGYQCPDSMLNTGKGVASFYDRYEKTLEKHTHLRELVHADSRSEDLRKELEMLSGGLRAGTGATQRKTRGGALQWPH